MSVTINGSSGVTTPGISNSEGYTGDGLSIAAGAPSGAVAVDASGNVGVGTSSPSVKLDVVGQGRILYGTGATNTGDQNAVTVGATTTGAYASSYGAALQFQVTNSGGGYSGGRIVSRLGADNFTANLVFQARNYGFTDSMTLDSSGNLLVGTTSGSYHILRKDVTRDAGNATVEFQSTASATSQIWYGVTVYGANGANAATKVGRDGVTSRSINAGGTVNASGADYAEYMTKSGDFEVSKGDVVGINAEGKLTNVFTDAISFCVKSTDPSYVGGDVWGNEDAIGARPANDATDEEKAAYTAALETARQKVDRIAFAGQVPVNVIGATPGQYIVPINDNGAIKGIAKNEADMTLAEYMKSVGKVISIKDDGRAFIIVKVA